MKTQKYYIYMKSEERNQIIAALNKLRNRLLEQGKYTDTVDDTLIKICGAKKKKIKIS